MEAEMKIRVCDRCKKKILTHDEFLQDEIDAKYMGHDICPECDIQITMMEAVARESAISGKSQKQILHEWLAMYQKPSE
jgi:DNA-directed RNA polymerase subunit RPC12/RpoP